ncbi:DUF262 domain-containing protein [Parageobacillus toebii]|uniref:DUF262 domain-containing protein n=1 Tax=Parageobacillus toebii TaxID=153151 RepID=UPI0028163D6B|nr:DUF262 domain-containing protein [Parageobacillus toebii]WMT18167.1 DUF262 domain-containing protein [Parageobacillus toebii]
MDNSYENIPFDDEWNEDIVEDLKLNNYKSIVVYSRDWTIETIFNQIKQNNIDLNPKFQRRNAWNDEKRSRLIESLILGLPVPEIVLAEHPTKRKSFIVIDGKQRLLTIAGFMDPKNIQYWKVPKLTKLQQTPHLNGKTFEDISEDPSLADVKREFENADIRCTVISNYRETDVLYDIFYRLNTGSVPLSTQELRQVLNKGPFADYLYEATQEFQPLHHVMGLKGADSRLRDIEMLLRFISIKLFGKEYKGDLKRFLDESMRKINDNWDLWKETVKDTHRQMNLSINRLIEVFTAENVGRKFIDGKYEKRFNKVLFEVQTFYFLFVNNDDLTPENKEELKKQFEKLCEDVTFRTSLEASTKTIAQYRKRYSLFKEYINKVLGKNIQEIPVPLD